MSVIKATTTEEARLSILLHQSRQSESAMARHIIKLVKRINSLTADKVAAESAFETLHQEIDRANCEKRAAEREVRRLKALRYAPKKPQGWVQI
jgi:septal ring factor EnvC (AmiA/AmiB activator)